MEQFFEFLLNHAVLTFAFIGLAVALVWTSITGGGPGQLSPAEAVQLISREDAVVLDLRSDTEFRNGHIVNAVHVPFEQIEARLPRLNRYREQPVIAACRAGQQAPQAVKRLQAAGFQRMYRLQGGMQAWQGADLPLAKD